jgi:hypothetical protein
LGSYGSRRHKCIKQFKCLKILRSGHGPSASSLPRSHTWPIRWVSTFLVEFESDYRSDALSIELSVNRIGWCALDEFFIVIIFIYHRRPNFGFLRLHLAFLFRSVFLDFQSDPQNRMKSRLSRNTRGTCIQGRSERGATGPFCPKPHCWDIF